MLALRARIFALLSAIALLLPGGALAGAHYFCRMMERVQPACCCAGERAAGDGVRRAELRHPDCCEQLAQPSRSAASAAAELPLDVPGPAVAALLAVEAWIGDAPSSIEAAPRQARSPPGLGPPLFITHCSLLS